MSIPGEKLRMHHIGIVARDEAQIEEFKRILGLAEEARETIEKYHVTNVFLKCDGDTKLHFMIPHKGVLKNFNGGRGVPSHSFLRAGHRQGAEGTGREGDSVYRTREAAGDREIPFQFRVAEYRGIERRTDRRPRCRLVEIGPDPETGRGSHVTQ